MKQIQMVMDRSGVIDNEFTSPEEIINALENYKDIYIPITIGHDVRNPPVGRSWPTAITVDDDGTHLLQADGEVFEESDDLDLIPKGKRVVRIQAEEVETFQALGNQTFEEDENRADLYRELQRLGSGEASQAYRENSVDPISLLMLGCGVFVLQGISNGFFSKLGEDLYESLKLKLKAIYGREPLKAKEQLLLFKFFVNNSAGRTVEVDIVITNPSYEDIDGFFDFVPAMLDTLLPQIPLDDLDLCRVVFSYQFTELKVLYGLRSDSIPVMLYYREK